VLLRGPAIHLKSDFVQQVLGSQHPEAGRLRQIKASHFP